MLYGFPQGKGGVDTLEEGPVFMANRFRSDRYDLLVEALGLEVGAVRGGGWTGLATTEGRLLAEAREFSERDGEYRYAPIDTVQILSGESVYLFAAIPRQAFVKTGTTVAEMPDGVLDLGSWRREGKSPEWKAILGPRHFVATGRLKTTRAESSARQQEILGLAASGLGDKEIAQRLGVSVHTVDFHWRRIRRGGGSRAECTARFAAGAYRRRCEDLEAEMQRVATELWRIRHESALSVVPPALLRSWPMATLPNRAE